MEHKYGLENTCQVGTWTMVGVKNGLKDVARVLDLPFAEANELTKNFDDGITWKDIDAMEGEEKKAIDLLEEKYTEFLGNKVQCHEIPIRPGRNLAIILESAAINHRQKQMGYNAAQELYRRVQQSLTKKK